MLDEILGIQKQINSRSFGTYRVVPEEEILSSVKAQGHYTFSDGDIFADGEDISISVQPLGEDASVHFPHKHDFFELVYVIAGSGASVTNGEEIGLTEGDILVMNTNTIHDYSKSSQDFTIINLYLKRSLLEASVLSLTEPGSPLANFFVDNLYDSVSSQPYFYLSAERSTRIEGLFLVMLESSLSRSDVLYRKIMRSLLQSFFLLVLDQYRRRAAQESYGELLDAVLEHIDKSSGSATIVSTAREFGYNPNYMSRLIKSGTGKSFSEILQHYRLKNVQSLLLSTDMTVDEITDVVGYNNPSYLTNLFKRRFGITPSAYRRQHEGNAGR